ncbi:class I SAM-dependent methyltransferase [Campylobacter sp. LR291e]|uniref:class I SAM-dependent methyltransferase n=1 Tax=unclassified Campylobacter TaxID=2593542 RepID=UPI00123BD722|nr:MULTISPECIES: class I SAM-dependent methyltransferase [unclassified Campylobacter]KAA6225436.1 class I SAM-dependent methyltransferase [Campylobacter sp. LR196d]KAA6234232.1 class I SAM-dependent methyltransferase [Campylobacter sp. LR291e]
MQNQEVWHNNHAQKRHQIKYPHHTVIPFVFKNYKKKDRILDLGCGAGRHVKFLAENGFKAYGMDYSKNGVKFTKKLLKKHSLKAKIKLSSVDNIPFKDDFFDGLICIGVLDYNNEEIIQKAANEIYRVLKKGAKALIISRNIQDYRYEKAEKLSKNYTIIRESNPSLSAYAENGMNAHFFDEEEARLIFKNFEKIEINVLRTSYQNNTFCDESFIIILQK